MKKLFLLLCLSVALASCYSATYYVGDISKDTPSIQINSVKNHSFVCGLVPTKNADVYNAKYVKQYKSYKVKHYISPIDGLIGILTSGIYTPSSTEYYIPVEK